MTKTTKPSPRVLGPMQRSMLRTMEARKSWYDGCGWIWDTRSKTISLLESLVARGYVRKVETEHVRYDYIDPTAHDRLRKERLIERFADVVSRYDDGTGRILYVPDDLFVILADGALDFFEKEAEEE